MLTSKLPVFEISVSTQVLDVVLKATSGSHRTRDGLTNAEREILARIVAGEGNAAIAAARHSALRTVANQVASLLKKLHIASRHEVLPTMLKRGSTKRVTDGEIHLVLEHAGDLYEVTLRPGHVASCESLRGRELAVVERVARGMSDKEIAYELGVAVGSVSTLLWRVRQRCGLGGRGAITVSWLATARQAG